MHCWIISGDDLIRKRWRKLFSLYIGTVKRFPVSAVGFLYVVYWKAHEKRLKTQVRMCAVLLRRHTFKVSIVDFLFIILIDSWLLLRVCGVATGECGSIYTLKSLTYFRAAAKIKVLAPYIFNNNCWRSFIYIISLLLELLVIRLCDRA